MNHDMSRLGPFGFQDFAAAVVTRALGAHVRPMGRGRDGGRDMLATDPVTWSADLQWTGTTVFQARYREGLTGRDDASWLWGEIKKELNAWASKEMTRGPVPDNLVFVTNVPLSAVPDSGGFDRINANIREWFSKLVDDSVEQVLGPSERLRAQRDREARRERMSALAYCKVVDGNHLDGWLSAYADVRRAFNGFLCVGDVLADLAQFAPALSLDEIGPALKQHARRALTNERNIYFDDAGATPKGFPIEQVVIDLPIHDDGDRGGDGVIRYVLKRGDHLLRPSLSRLSRPRHIVVAGAPGNGKTTVSKFLVHAFRAAWLAEDGGLGDEHGTAIAGARQALRDLRWRLPHHRRWPLRVDLAHFAVAKATDPNYSLLTFVCETLTKQAASKPVIKSVLSSWLRSWPSLLVLDGLDEVTEPSVRQGLIAEVEAFVSEAETSDWDTLVVVTTRPTGYEDELSERTFERVDLADLSLDDALRYGRLVTKMRIPSDEGRRNAINASLEEAARQEPLQRLLRTPLQVLIMSIIAESARRFAPSRFDLFHTYYQTIEQRERDKPFGLSALLRDHASEVLDLHRRVGLILQDRAQLAASSESTLPAADLRATAWQVLHDAGYQPSGTDRRLLDRMVEAATNRLVLLTPQRDGNLGFDVRSLQELMAAIALTTGTVEESVPRLARIAVSPHWRNTFLFAAGRYFSEPQPHQKAALTALVTGIDNAAEGRLATVLPIGPGLALDMVDDAMVSEPRFLHPLAEHALLLLHHPEPADRLGFTRKIVAVAAISDSLRGLVADRLRQALSGSAVPRGTALGVQAMLKSVVNELDPRAELRGLALVKRDPKISQPPEPIADWRAFWAVIEDYSTGEEKVSLLASGHLLQDAANGTAERGWDSSIGRYLEDPDLAFVLELALAHVAEASPQLIQSLRRDVMPGLMRRPVRMLDLSRHDQSGSTGT